MQSPQLSQNQRFVYVQKFQAQNFQKTNQLFPVNRQHLQQPQALEFDGKRLRKAVTRKTVDYNSSIIKYLEARVWQRDYRDRRAIQPDAAYYTEMMPPLSMPDNPINAVTTKFVRTSTNKMRCPIFCVAWTPEGRRLVTGASSGEFTLWNGLTFNFETILQAHDSPVRCMVWSHNDIWMVTGDHAGYVKYWQSNMNNVKMFQAHKEPLRGISFCPGDTKFVTCSDDGTVRIWDFLKCYEEKILRGHGADVKCVDWHPQKSLIVSGSKDSQQPIKLWDPKSGQSLATVHAHKNTVMDTKWNKNGNWLLTASRDHLIKLFDIRNMNQEMQIFRGHKKEATTLAWHPIHEGLFASGGSDGSVMFWVVGADKEVGSMEQAHDSCVWSLAWHPLGHILCSGSNDHSSKFWTRNRPGDRMRDKYNLNTLPKGQEDTADYDDTGIVSSIPGMGLEFDFQDGNKLQDKFEKEIPLIPGLDLTCEDSATEKSQQQKKIPFSKPIPKQFQQQWMESKQPLLLAPPQDERNNESTQPVNNESIPPPSMHPIEQNQYGPGGGGNQYPPMQGPPNYEPLQRPPTYPDERLDRIPPLGSTVHNPIDRNIPHDDMPYPKLPNYPHNTQLEEQMPRDRWKGYSDHHPMDMEGPLDDIPIRENGAQMPPLDHNEYDLIRERGLPPPPHHRSRHEIYPPEDNFLPDDMPMRGGPPPYDDMRYPDIDLPPPMPPGPDHMSYREHKHMWDEEDYPMNYPIPEYDIPPPMEYGPRGPPFRGMRGHRFRGRRPFFRGRGPPRNFH